MVETFPTAISEFLTPAAWERLAERLRLSPREVQILQGLLEDHKESAIARLLSMSAHTVHAHMDRLHRKLSVSSRVQLILKIVATFLVLTAESGSPLPPICGKCTLESCQLDSGQLVS